MIIRKMKNGLGLTDGSKWGFTSWAKGEPNNAWWEENRLMTNWKNSLGKWNDAKAKAKELFFCQYPLKGKLSSQTESNCQISTSRG